MNKDDENLGETQKTSILNYLSFILGQMMDYFFTPKKKTISNLHDLNIVMPTADGITDLTIENCSMTRGALQALLTAEIKNLELINIRITDGLVILSSHQEFSLRGLNELTIKNTDGIQMPNYDQVKKIIPNLKKLVIEGTCRRLSNGAKKGREALLMPSSVDVTCNDKNITYVSFRSQQPVAQNSLLSKSQKVPKEKKRRTESITAQSCKKLEKKSFLSYFSLRK